MSIAAAEQALAHDPLDHCHVDEQITDADTTALEVAFDDLKDR